MWVTVTVAMLACVLAMAGGAKLQGDGRRLQGAGELGLAGAALLAPARLSAGVLALVFAGFAIVHVRGGVEPAEGCDCFGEPAGLAADHGVRRLVLTAASAALAAAASVVAWSTPVRSPAALAVQRPASGLPALAVALLLALVWRSGFAGTGGRRRSSVAPSGERGRPARDRLTRDHLTGERLITASAGLLERRFSRRGMLVRLAAAGSALTVAPLRYLLYPGTALAAISPDQCGSGACTDGYTAFCCQINHGLNSCPTGTFAGGWWMCTDYPGRRLCAAEGVRYYVDCNALPGREYPGGCRCANGTCEEQRVACNIFRYGQCNTHVAGVTAVVCRMVVCENPSTISEFNCSASLAVDDAVCEQDAPCLEPAIVVGAPGGV